MSASPNQDDLRGLVHELCKLPQETEWVEFKVNNYDPQAIGKYISALANTATLLGKGHAYMVWGVEDTTHAIIGTDFSPLTARKGNEHLETWLLRLLNPRIDFRFREIMVGEQRVVLLEVDPGQQPVAFHGVEYIRVSSTMQKLRDYPEKERALWRALDRVRFEDGIAAERVSGEEVLLQLDYPAYFNLLEVPLPDSRTAVLDALQQDQLLTSCTAGGFNITNLGAILFAKKLGDFPGLRRKTVRVIQYRGMGRIETLKEWECSEGYACSFERLLSYINGLLPTNEVIGEALRKSVPMFPEHAVRELVANALIHQDFSMSGAGPMVEIFEGRIEITNPGEPLVDTQRFLDTPPQSRNETLASHMRRFGICEERGSGIDKVVFQVEFFQLPAPLFEVPVGFTRTVLFAHKSLAKMKKEDRVRSCYLHACLQYVSQQPMTNTSLRKRFGIAKENASIASRLLNEAVEAGKILVENPEVGTRIRRYLPFWARSASEVD